MPNIAEKSLHASKLRAILKDGMRESRRTMDDLTVLSKDSDPYRLGTPTGHLIGAWFSEQLQMRRGDRQTHLRGFHYALVAAGDVRKPDTEWRDNKDGKPAKDGANGAIYENTEADWLWLGSCG